VVVGKIGVTLGSSTIILNKGEGITIPVCAIHRIKGIEDSTILEIALGEFDETDIIRLADDFGRSGTKARRN
jgi:mannose-6-phosphate isomerase-like protein (cupin superfamily)